MSPEPFERRLFAVAEAENPAIAGVRASGLVAQVHRRLGERRGKRDPRPEEG